MNEYLNKINSEIEHFQVSMSELLNVMKKTAPLWNDSKFQELSDGIIQIANTSSDILTYGDRLKRSISSFSETAKEKI